MILHLRNNVILWSHDTSSIRHLASSFIPDFPREIFCFWLQFNLLKLNKMGDNQQPLYTPFFGAMGATAAMAFSGKDVQPWFTGWEKSIVCPEDCHSHYFGDEFNSLQRIYIMYSTTWLNIVVIGTYWSHCWYRGRFPFCNKVLIRDWHLFGITRLWIMITTIGHSLTQVWTGLVLVWHGIRNWTDWKNIYVRSDFIDTRDCA